MHVALTTLNAVSSFTYELCNCHSPYSSCLFYNKVNVTICVPGTNHRPKGHITIVHVSPLTVFVAPVQVYLKTMLGFVSIFSPVSKQYETKLEFNRRNTNRLDYNCV